MLPCRLAIPAEAAWPLSRPTVSALPLKPLQMSINRAPDLGLDCSNRRRSSDEPWQGVSAETTAFANYYSLPVASVPCRFDSHDMPIGLQIVGKPVTNAPF